MLRTMDQLLESHLAIIAEIMEPDSVATGEFIPQVDQLEVIQQEACSETETVADQA